ncbi:hypothetical protein GOA90_25320 [Sinorhizobium meliloti]|nr:hypothetical protein [Sinorhizobium meliloti]
MSKHTPGPWRAELSPYRRTLSVVSETTWICGELLNPSTMPEGEAWANARLIAAAPDLLAALKSLGPILEEIHDKWDEGMRAGKLIVALRDPKLNYRADITAIHAAIAKAEGRE